MLGETSENESDVGEDERERMTDDGLLLFEDVQARVNRVTSACCCLYYLRWRVSLRWWKNRRHVVRVCTDDRMTTRRPCSTWLPPEPQSTLCRSNWYRLDNTTHSLFLQQTNLSIFLLVVSSFSAWVFVHATDLHLYVFVAIPCSIPGHTIGSCIDIHYVLRLAIKLTTYLVIQFNKLLNK